jgi:hypothetical protein
LGKNEVWSSDCINIFPAYDFKMLLNYIF